MKPLNFFIGLLIVALLSFAVAAAITKDEGSFLPASLNITYNDFMDFNFTVNSTVTSAINVTLWQTPVNNDTDWFRNFTMFCANATACGNSTPLVQGFYNWYLEIDEGTSSNTTTARKYFQVRALAAGENFTWVSPADTAVMWLDKNFGNLRALGNLFIDANGTFTNLFATNNVTAGNDVDVGDDIFVGDDLNVAGDSYFGGGYAGGSGATLWGADGSFWTNGDIMLDGELIVVYGIGANGSIVPIVNDTFDVGNDTNIFRKGYFGDVDVARQLNVSGDALAGRFLAENGTAASPSFTFRDDSDTGFYKGADNRIATTLGGVTYWEFRDGWFGINAATKPALLNEVSTSTNPNIVPNIVDIDTGIGSQAADNLSLISGGNEVMRLGGNTTAGYNQVIITPNALGLGGAGTPSLAFGDGDTGFYEGVDNALNIVTNGFSYWFIDSSYLGSNIATRGTFINQDASNVLPTFVPRKNDPNTGIGWASADNLSLIAGAWEVARASNTTDSTVQFIINPSNVQNDATKPVLAFGDGDTGFYEESDDKLVVVRGGFGAWFFQSNNFHGVASGGPGLNNAVATAISPNFYPNLLDTNTGIGWASADALSLIAGGKELMRLDNNSNQVIVGDDTSPTNLNVSLGNMSVNGQIDTGEIYVATPPAACPAGSYMTYTEGNATTCTAAMMIEGDNRLTGNYTWDSSILHVNDSNELNLTLAIPEDSWIAATNASLENRKNIIQWDSVSEGIGFGGPLFAGTYSFAEDAGRVTWANMPVSATTQGTVMEYVLAMDSNNMLGIYAEADGVGGVQNKQVKAYVDHNMTEQNLTMDFGDILDAGMVWAENFYGLFNWTISANSTDYLGFDGGDLWLDMFNINTTALFQITTHNASMKEYTDANFVTNTSANFSGLAISENITFSNGGIVGASNASCMTIYSPDKSGILEVCNT